MFLIRWLFKILFFVFTLLLVTTILLWITGNSQIIYGVSKTYLIGKTSPDIDDMKYFDVSTIMPGEPEPWPLASDFNRYQLAEDELRFLDSLKTTALLVFRNDSMVFENYWEGYQHDTPSNSFSMAKSFMAMLYGPAIEEGYIQGLDQPVSDFLDGFDSGKNGELTLRDLLVMASGIPFGESYSSPFGYMAKAYYGKDLEKETMKFAVEVEPGTRWKYEGGNSVLLGMILKKATGKTPSKYFEEKVWSCIGAEHPAYWNLDKAGGMEKTFSGFYATASDFARIGKLYMHQGTWGTDTLIPPSFVTASITANEIPDENGEACSWYGMHWWLGEHNGKPFFSCRGMRGQYIIGIPSEHIIIVRLGHLKIMESENHMTLDLPRYLELGQQIAGNNNEERH